MSLKFNSFRAARYLRSKFVEGKYLLASEASDLELEIMDELRRTVKKTVGDVAIDTAWQVKYLNATQLLVTPGEAWKNGLPFSLRFGKDHLVSGALLVAGIVPVGVIVSDDSSGLGKIITFNNVTPTPSNTYRIVVTAQEELVTNIDDPFLQNANLTESTSQKVKLVFKLNLVPDSLQSESPVPYTDENSTSLSITNYPNTGGFASPNLSNDIIVTPVSAGNGELISSTLLSGSAQIDGRDVEITLRNDPGIGGGNPIPRSPVEQQAFSNGTLIDSNGSSFHINAIFNDVISTQVIIRIDKEPGQSDPEIVNTKAFKLIKREVYVTDDVNGSPQGRMYLDLASVVFDATNGIVHPSTISDLRSKVISQYDYQQLLTQKLDMILVDGGDLNWSSSTSIFSWAANLRLLNPHGAAQTISSDSAALIDGGSLAYTMNLAGGTIQKGTLSVTVTAAGATSTLSSSPSSLISLGNILVDSTGLLCQITAVNSVTNTITTNPAISATGSATIYLDSYGPSTLPINSNLYVLAVRSGTAIFIADGLELKNGETTQLGSVPTQLLTFIGSPSETTSAPTYTSTGVVVQGTSLVTAISALDAGLGPILNSPTYDEVLTIVSPVSSGGTLTLPVNSRVGGTPQEFYTVGKGTLEVFLNGQYLNLGLTNGWAEIGISGSSSSTIQINQDLLVDDAITFRIS